MSVSDAKYKDLVVAMSIVTFNLVLSFVNLKDWLIQCSSKNTSLTHGLLCLILVCIVHSTIRVIDLYLTNDFFPLWLDVLKSFLGQLINPLAMVIMFVRALALMQKEKYRRWRMVAYCATGIVLFFGFAMTIYREYLHIAYQPDEDKIFGGLRTVLATITNTSSIVLELVFTSCFFYELYQGLLGLGNDETGKRIMIANAIFEGLVILIIGLVFAIVAPNNKTKFITPLLQAVGVLSARFLLDLMDSLKRSLSSIESYKSTQKL
ncbi:hypothetical protein EDD86DRAFT_200555 [Gorgonomyces haynaldii]|nr:hypothetical protein EDD86DRAFT_200555 [Gorgonomyces haynaldii]